MKFVKGFLLVTIIIIMIGLAGTGVNKAYWDYQVKGMCERDGGVEVFEVVSLTKDQYLKNAGNSGNIQILSKRISKARHDFYRQIEDTVINGSNPRVVKSEYITYRKSDEKILGKFVTYSRVGGDFPTGFHRSSFSCADMIGFKTNTIKEIFLVEMERD